MISESKILNRSLEPDDIELSLDLDQGQEVSHPCEQPMQNLENLNHTVMKENSEQKLVVLEDESCMMEVPDSDGEAMPENNYEFNTNKREEVIKHDTFSLGQLDASNTGSKSSESKPKAVVSFNTSS